jgi:hypothetical protein
MECALSHLMKHMRLAFNSCPIDKCICVRACVFVYIRQSGSITNRIAANFTVVYFMACINSCMLLYAIGIRGDGYCLQPYCLFIKVRLVRRAPLHNRTISQIYRSEIMFRYISRVTSDYNLWKTSNLLHTLHETTILTNNLQTNE